MRKFRYLLAVIALFVLVVSFTAVEGAPRKTEITFWNLFGGGEGDYVDQIVGDFNKSQAEVTVKTLRLEWNEYYAKFGVSLAAGRGPDVAVCHLDRLAPYIKAKQLAALDDLARETGFSFGDIADNLEEAVQFGSAHYAVPLDTHFHMFYYNKEILGKAGLLNANGTPKLTATPEGFRAFLQQIKDQVSGITPFPVNTPYFHEPFYNLYYQAGGDLLNKDLTKATINNEKAISVLKYYLSLYDSGLSDINDKNPYQTFGDGKGAVWLGGVWEGGVHFSKPQFAAIAIPPIFGSSSKWGSSHTLVIPAYVKKAKQTAAMKFMKYFTDTGGAIWGQAGHVPAGKAIVASQEYRNLPYRQQFLEGQETVKFAPKVDKFNAIDTTVKEHLQNIIFKKVTPEVGLKQLEQNINEILEK